ncbi:MAG: DUF4168 domain-containing protein [Bacteroidales bacterium]|nr:DUF4168 domain-containing protein [Bacteroidales bacterium]
MYLSKKRSYFTAIIATLFLLFSMPAQAKQDGFSDEELKGFANAVVQVISLQQQGQMQMMQKIEEYEMTVQRFNELYMQAMEMPLDEIDGTEAEIEVFIDLTEEIEYIQIELEAVIIGKIEDEGLTVEKYEEIMAAYQQNPEVQQRVQKLMQ